MMLDWRCVATAAAVSTPAGTALAGVAASFAAGAMLSLRMTTARFSIVFVAAGWSASSAAAKLRGSRQAIPNVIIQISESNQQFQMRAMRDMEVLRGKKIDRSNRKFHFAATSGEISSCEIRETGNRSYCGALPCLLIGKRFRSTPFYSGDG
jgi:hypothetical protein